MGRDVQLEIDRTNFFGSAAVISLHGWEFRCSRDFRDERFYNVRRIHRAKDRVLTAQQSLLCHK